MFCTLLYCHTVVDWTENGARGEETEAVVLTGHCLHSDVDVELAAPRWLRDEKLMGRMVEDWW